MRRRCKQPPTAHVTHLFGTTRKAFREGMKEAEDEESNSSSEPKQIKDPAVTSISDEELMAEMRRRSEAKSS